MIKYGMTSYRFILLHAAEFVAYRYQAHPISRLDVQFAPGLPGTDRRRGLCSSLLLTLTLSLILPLSLTLTQLGHFH